MDDLVIKSRTWKGNSSQAVFERGLVRDSVYAHGQSRDDDDGVAFKSRDQFLAGVSAVAGEFARTHHREVDEVSGRQFASQIQSFWRLGDFQQGRRKFFFFEFSYGCHSQRYVS